MSEKYSWYNYVTGEYVGFKRPETDEEAMQYIPQVDPALNIYRCYRELSDDSLHALVKTLEIAVKAWKP